MDISEQQVKKANKEFYDIVRSSYETIDGRRSESLACYVTEQLKEISQNTGADSILDLGCGNGFVSKLVKPYFKQRYALDISPKILDAIDDLGLHKIAADFDLIPIDNDRLDCVAAFAVLHHCFSYEKMLSEVYRILKDGGVFYSDHDLDCLFFKRFRLLLKLYRKINNASKHYRSKFSQISEQMYDHSEFHQDGIPVETIESILKSVNFKFVEFKYHWFGLSPFFDKIFGKRSYRRGYAPIVRIIAKK